MATTGATVSRPGSLILDHFRTAGATLRIESAAFRAGDRIPERYAGDGKNVSPPLHWSAGPAGTESYALILEDPDAPKAVPFVHWILYDIPANMTMLEEGLPTKYRLTQPAGALQGKNDFGEVGYFGPRPPVGHPVHNYHFEVYALDKKIGLPLGAGRADFMGAIEGHVLAAGDYVGTYQR